MKKVIRLTESDLINIVKRVINESDEKSTFELKIETTPDDQLGPVIENFFATKTEAEIKQYFMELSNRNPKPKWIQKLIKFFKNDKNKNKKINTKSIGKALVGYSILFMLQQIFKIPLPLPSKPVNEQKRPHSGDPNFTQSNTKNVGEELKNRNFKIDSSDKNGKTYVGESKTINTIFHLNINGTYRAVARNGNYSGTWKLVPKGTKETCPGGFIKLTNCNIFDGVKFLTDSGR
jgi:hypothetical protein